jgi:hypothetical protein
MRRLAIFTIAASLVAATSAQAVSSPAGTSTRAADPRDRIICRRYLRTGSLADTYRTCKTRGEWDREQENIRQLSVSDTCRMRGDPDPSNGGHAQDC